ncbi:hypothetical protein ES702_06832 [subsurface metagenome]
MSIQIGIPPWWYGKGWEGDGELIPHDHSTIEEGGAVPLTSITGHSKAVHDALAILHSSLGNIGVDNHHPKIHKAEHESGGADEINHNLLVNYLASQHKTLPTTIAQVLSDHNKAIHDALAINADLVDGKHIPEKIENILTDHDKALHDTMAINAYSVQGETPTGIVSNTRVKSHFPDTIAAILSNHSLAVHETLGLAKGSVPACRVNKAYPDQVCVDGVSTQIIYDEETYDNLNNFNTGTYKFTVPSGWAGRYFLMVSTVVEDIGAEPPNEHHADLWVMVNTTRRVHDEHFFMYQGMYAMHAICVAHLNVGDTVWGQVAIYTDGAGDRNITADPYSNFMVVQKLVD